MANIFERLGKGEGVFTDEGKLSPDYVPVDVLFREREVKEFAFCLQGAARGGKGEHLIATGPPGTGKTTCARHVLSQLSEYSKKAVPIYINCWEFSTRYAIFGEIANLLGEVLPRRGIASDEMMGRIVQNLKREKKSLIVVLDEADRLFLEKEEGILYDFARAPETSRVNVGIIAIANNKEAFTAMDARIRSSLCAKMIEFLPYSPAQLKEILKARAKAAFFPNALGDEVIDLCAGIGAKNGGDARIALSVLRGAGKEAEREGARKVTLEHVKRAKEGVLGGIAKRKFPLLDENLQKIFEFVEKKGEIDSVEIYSHFGAKGESEERKMRKWIAKLEELEFLEGREFVGGEGRGKRVRVKPRGLKPAASE